MSVPSSVPSNCRPINGRAIAFAHRAADVATLLFAATALLQLLLALGALPITAAWGGRQEELTLGLRIASLAAIGVLAAFAWLVRRRAGLAGAGAPSRALRIGAWAIAGLLLLNTLGNLASLSRAEQLLFTPLSLTLALAVIVVARSRPTDTR